jgi:hypothetical protein
MCIYTRVFILIFLLSFLTLVFFLAAHAIEPKIGVLSSVIIYDDQNTSSGRIWEVAFAVERKTFDDTKVTNDFFNSEIIKRTLKCFLINLL